MMHAFALANINEKPRPQQFTNEKYGVLFFVYVRSCVFALCVCVRARLWQKYEDCWYFWFFCCCCCFSAMLPIPLFVLDATTVFPICWTLCLFTTMYTNSQVSSLKTKHLSTFWCQRALLLPQLPTPTPIPISSTSRILRIVSKGM